MKIRRTEPGDAPALFALLQAKAAFDGCADSLIATEPSLRQALFCERPLAHALVAEVDQTLVGMATYHATFSSFIAKPGIWLDDLFVCDAYRGRGIGRRLMQQLCEVAVTAACGRIDWHVSSANTRGIAFYRGLGADISDKARLVRLDDRRIRELACQKA